VLEWWRKDFQHLKNKLGEGVGPSCLRQRVMYWRAIVVPERPAPSALAMGDEVEPPSAVRLQRSRHLFEKENGERRSRWRKLVGC
jgi:hypothetical protein